MFYPFKASRAVPREGGLLIQAAAERCCRFQVNIRGLSSWTTRIQDWDCYFQCHLSPVGNLLQVLEISCWCGRVVYASIFFVSFLSKHPVRAELPRPFTPSIISIVLRRWLLALEVIGFVLVSCEHLTPKFFSVPWREFSRFRHGYWMLQDVSIERGFWDEFFRHDFSLRLGL